MAEMSWQGATKIVNPRKIRQRGALYVAEYRLRNMSKFAGVIVAFGLGNPVLYLASVGLGIGALVDNNLGAAGVDGVSYLVFLAPALLASAAIQGTMDETMFPTLAGFVWMRNFYAMNSTALTGAQIARGVLLSALSRTLFTVFIYWSVLWIFGAVDATSSVWLIPSAIFAGWACGAAMLAGASYVESDDGFFAIVGRFVIAPMFLFSGTYYPLETLPVFLQWIGWISPLWHATELGRTLSYGDVSTNVSMTVLHVATLAIMGFVCMKIAERKYSMRLAA